MTGLLADALAGARRELELAWAAEDERELELTAAERYARDPIAWLNDFAVIASKFADRGDRHSVLMDGKVRPARLRLWPNQEETLAAWIDLDQLARTGELALRNVLVEKSRQEGETWVLAGAVDWILQYHEAVGLYLHQRAAEVADRGWTTKSFFGRVKYIDDRLDRRRVPGLAPLRFMPFSKDPAAIINTRTGSQAYGEVQRDDPGRGQSLDYAIVDEAAHIQHGEHVHAALDEACKRGKVYVSTPMGDSNVHARLCDAKPAGYTYLRLHWSEHPIYGQGLHVAGEDASCDLCRANRAGVVWRDSDPRAHRFPGRPTSPWYDQAVLGKTVEQVASELDIDREGALPARVFTEFSTGTHVLDGVSYDPRLPVELAADYGLDATSIPIIQDHPQELRVIGLVEMGDLFGSTATPELVAAELRRVLVELGVPEQETWPECTRHWYAVGDPAGHARSLDTGKPYVQAYRRQGFNFRKPPSRLTRRVDFSLLAVKRLLLGKPKPLRVCGVNAAEFARHLRNNTWPADASGHRSLGATAPLDDVHNHCCRAFAYYALTKFPPPEALAGGGSSRAGDMDEDGEEDPVTRRRRRVRARGGEASPADAVLDSDDGPLTMSL